MVKMWEGVLTSVVTIAEMMPVMFRKINLYLLSTLAVDGSEKR